MALVHRSNISSCGKLPTLSGSGLSQSIGTPMGSGHTTSIQTRCAPAITRKSGPLPRVFRMPKFLFRRRSAIRASEIHDQNFWGNPDASSFTNFGSANPLSTKSVHKRAKCWRIAIELGCSLGNCFVISARITGWPVYSTRPDAQSPPAPHVSRPSPRRSTLPSPPHPAHPAVPDSLPQYHATPPPFSHPAIQ